MDAPDRIRADELGVQQLRSFCLVFERQSYTAVAREIDVSVPTVWEQVQAVERRYSTVLFERRGRRIYPTPTAHVLYESLRPLLAGLDSTFELIREHEGAGPGTLTLVTGARMLIEELAPALKRFQKAYPSVCLRLMHGDNSIATRLIGAEEADLALTLEPGPDVLDESVSYERAYANDHLAVFPGKHPLARKPKLHLRDLVEFPLIVGHRGTYGRRVLEQALYREGLHSRLRIAVETDNSAFTVACVRAGLGVGLLAGRQDGLLMRRLASRPLRDELGQANIVFMWKNGRVLTRMLQDLMDCVRAVE